MFSKPNKPVAHRAAPSIIGSNCSLAGDILSEGEVHIDGKVIGDVRCITLVIGEGGGITGEINAETVRVLGAVTGQITARAVELAKTARILGDITHDSLAVEAGAYVEGRFNRLPHDEPAVADPGTGKVPALSGQTEGVTAADASQATSLVMLGN